MVIRLGQFSQGIARGAVWLRQRRKRGGRRLRRGTLMGAGGAIGEPNDRLGRVRQLQALDRAVRARSPSRAGGSRRNADSPPTPPTKANPDGREPSPRSGGEPPAARAWTPFVAGRPTSIVPEQSTSACPSVERSPPPRRASESTRNPRCGTNGSIRGTAPGGVELSTNATRSAAAHRPDSGVIGSIRVYQNDRWSVHDAVLGDVATITLVRPHQHALDEGVGLSPEFPGTQRVVGRIGRPGGRVLEIDQHRSLAADAARPPRIRSPDAIRQDSIPTRNAGANIRTVERATDKTPGPSTPRGPRHVRNMAVAVVPPLVS